MSVIRLGFLINILNFVAKINKHKFSVSQNISCILKKVIKESKQENTSIIGFPDVKISVKMQSYLLCVYKNILFSI